MTSDRPYRATCSWETAIGEIEQHAGTQFDPAVVEAFGVCEPALREIHTVLAA